MLGLLTGGAPNVRLTGPTLVLRPPHRRDEGQWIEIREKSREFLEFWEPKWPNDATRPAAFRRRLQRFNAEWREGTTHAFLIFGRENGTLYGGITLSNVRRGVAQCGSVGYWVGEAHARNGVMSEALQLLLNYAFDTLGLHRVEAACLPSNAPSRGLLAKSGFIQEGLARRYLRINGVWQDHVLFAILRADPRPGSPMYD
ncbi:MAG: putative ribosomal N-acetyltransferase YdaF [Alphaproteobacteria bacterium MarineAlpha10_Bin3]|nr:MAG: putative ribosomal N-acetyltransferase YdaF [Alphaproteobacteria bacterium MarineAlpha10_Bin3]PPR75758.1 MAG: putative ribosomal N-acetyltransferase YdaF [Alphaproteobacteria bacterium MarineAlpha4_Bin1]